MIINLVDALLCLKTLETKIFNLKQQENDEQVCSLQLSFLFLESVVFEQDFPHFSDENFAYKLPIAGVARRVKK